MHISLHPFGYVTDVLKAQGIIPAAVPVTEASNNTNIAGMDVDENDVIPPKFKFKARIQVCISSPVGILRINMD